MSIGKRIRFFRKRAGLTQRELGLALGFMPMSADVRIAQYENDSRTPKWLLREEIATTLGVSSAALTVPNIENDRELMHVLFALEDHCHLTITECDSVFQIEIPHQGFVPLSLDLLAWQDKQAKMIAGEITKEAYDNWRYNF